MTQADYLPVAIFALVAMIFPFLAFFATRFFRPQKPEPQKAKTYECGEVPVGEARIQFSFQYYIFALIFVVFDSVSIFVLLWALVLPGLDLVAKVYMILFISILFGVLLHALKKEETVKI